MDHQEQGGGPSYRVAIDSEDDLATDFDRSSFLPPR